MDYVLLFSGLALTALSRVGAGRKRAQERIRRVKRMMPSEDNTRARQRKI
jgi:hypothetical protein